MDEKTMEILRKPDMKGVREAILYKYIQRQKRNKLKSYKILNQSVKKGQILFVGSSLMEFFPINEMQQTLEKDCIIYNRGIAGFVTTELLASMNECIFELEPSKIFINIGTNDMNTPDYKKESLIENYDKILTQISEKLPNCKVYLMAYYPLNAKADFPGLDEEFKKSRFKTRTNTVIVEANKDVEKLAKKHNYKFINVNDGLMDEEGNLKEEFSIEGIHMWPNAYSVILENMKKYL
ncbi:GDSL-type esterase/lipase family protein [Clostridium sp. AWRP]|uniref:GDSL-type esterase/lipase family protein n=1 Tax=Clostridium sp. AWRP TaxID=2212991 RepID=UPI001FAA75E8|nr:GDSL-type esterase/lipase family protein [Clostridium sp. AWRP]